MAEPVGAAPASGASVNVLFVEDSGLVGGAELSLVRYLEHPDAPPATVIYLRGGPLTARVRATASQVTVLDGVAGMSGLLRQGRELRKLLRRANAELVVVNSLRAAFLVALVRPRQGRYVFYWRQEISRREQGLFALILARGFALRRFDAFIANSRWTESTMPRAVRRRPVRVAYPVSGIPESEPSGRPHATEASTVRVLSLSPLVPWKGTHVLLRALALLNDRGLADRVTLTVVASRAFSDPAYVEQLEAAAAPFGAQVSFADAVADVAPVLAAADLLVSASLAPEGFGQVIAQALAAGLLVVATAPGGSAEILEGCAAGRLVPMDDPEALAEAIEQVARQPRELAQQRGSALDRARRFTDDRTVAELTSVLAELAAGRC